MINVQAEAKIVNEYDKTRFANPGSHEWWSGSAELGINYDIPTSGSFQVYWPNGNSRYKWNYINGERADGVSKGWWPDGKLKDERTWKDGKQSGSFATWHENGRQMWSGSFKSGSRDGLWTFWDNCGRKKEDGSWVDGQRKGLWIWYHENGQKQWERTYEDGELNGAEILWHENGQIRGSGSYDDGNEVGVWTRWDATGSLVYRGDYTRHYSIQWGTSRKLNKDEAERSPFDTGSNDSRYRYDGSTIQPKSNVQNINYDSGSFDLTDDGTLSWK